MTGEFSSLSWIIDSGASHHVTSNRSCLSDAQHIQDWPVGLPNGEKVIATMIGRVVLSRDLSLENDRHSGSLIGAGERRDWLYFFRGIPELHAVTVPGLTDFELWHRRLGHPSDRVVKLVHAVSSSSVAKQLNKACVICPQAKQHRSIFFFK
ncbi:hypothetical protein ACHQM5_008820 [Ranunculus cassubicifolius]